MLSKKIFGYNFYWHFEYGIGPDSQTGSEYMLLKKVYIHIFIFLPESKLQLSLLCRTAGHSGEEGEGNVQEVEGGPGLRRPGEPGEDAIVAS